MNQSEFREKLLIKTGGKTLKDNNNNNNNNNNNYYYYYYYILKWTRDKLRQMDQRTRKLMTMHKALHPRDDVERLYVPRKEGGRGFASIEDSVDTSIQRLEDYI